MNTVDSPRRACLAALGCAVLGGAGCASEAGAPPRPAPLLGPPRVVGGGFLAPAGAPAARPNGIYAKLLSAGAVAVRDTELLVADVAAGRLWRADLVAGGFDAVAGAPVGPDTALALGPDQSAWVLDPPTRQVLRFARDGRLLQTWRAGAALASPVDFMLADGGATLLLADGLGAQWADQRGPGGTVQWVLPKAGGTRVASVQALAPAADGSLFVLDRLAAAVHRVQRDGTVLDTLGRGELAQPQAIAPDRFGRVWVLDPPARALVLLQAGQGVQRVPLASLGLARVSGLAGDGRQLALADAALGQVHVMAVGRGDGA